LSRRIDRSGRKSDLPQGYSSGLRVRSEWKTADLFEEGIPDFPVSECFTRAGPVSFKYDRFGRRIYKSSSSATSVYAYDGDNLIEETNATGGVVACYSQGLNIDEPLAMLRSATTSYYQADGLGSITSLSSGAGALAQTYTFDSFGNQTASSGSLTNPFQYTARESDSETGLYYYRARYYDANTGRFLSEDPLGSGGGLNFYRYVANSSPNLRDIFGLDYSTSRNGNTISVNTSITLYGPGANESNCDNAANSSTY